MAYDYCRHCETGINNKTHVRMSGIRCSPIRCIHASNEYDAVDGFVLALGHNPPPHTIEVQILPGTTVWEILVYRKKWQVIKRVVDSVTIGYDGYIRYDTGRMLWFHNRDIGKTIFLDRSYAEAALKERGTL